MRLRHGYIQNEGEKIKDKLKSKEVKTAESYTVVK